MSMISEQIQALRDVANAYKGSVIELILKDASNTIEELSAKLANANMERSEQFYNDGWIPCSERLPNENDYPEQRYRILASCTDGIVRNATIKSLIENEEKSCNGQPFFYIAWQPLPTAYVKGE